jgi:hypothetical protein
MLIEYEIVDCLIYGVGRLENIAELAFDLWLIGIRIKKRHPAPLSSYRIRHDFHEISEVEGRWREVKGGAA